MCRVEDGSAHAVSPAVALRWLAPTPRLPRPTTPMGPARGRQPAPACARTAGTEWGEVEVELDEKDEGGRGRG
eukprot:3159256-Pyramimonas_sp.AAC.1